jgi:hypothetical protein
MALLTAAPADAGETAATMWYPEESVTYCNRCDLEIPADCFWRGHGYIITASGQEVRTAVLFSQCPDCGQRRSVGLDGPWWYCLLYRWIWRLRYPYRRPPQFVAEAPPRRRAAGE